MDVAPGEPLPRAPRLLSRLGLALFGALAYVPVLMTAPGRVVADTKSYLTLDASSYLSGVASLWDPHIGLGTVSHQTVGYLFPMGPFYWILQDLLGVPSWVTQRLWLGTLILAAGLGVRYLLRTLGVSGAGVPIGMLAYAFTPYVLQYSSRLSVLLSPWAALPWMLAFVVLGLRSRPWRYAALFAITVQLVGAVNLTALLYALIGPALWIPYAIWIRRDTDVRGAWRLVWRVTLLTVITSAWWAMGLVVQARYGLSILRFTESIESVSATSTVTEIIRGLGYWFFYGSDKRGHWNAAVLDFTRQPLLIIGSFTIPALTMIGAAVIRWRDRAFFIVLALIAVTIAVAASPYHDPTVVGSWFKAFSTSSTAGLALRSTARAAPLMILSFALLLAVFVSAGVDALRLRGMRPLGVGIACGVGLVCIAGSPGVWHSRYYSEYLERPQAVPAYWIKALAALDARPHDTRVLTLPGSDFAAYRWGDTIDPIEPGLLERDYVARELVPWGSEASSNLLIALDRRLQSAVLEPDAVAPIARLMGAGDVLLRNDLETDRFSLIPARALWEIFTHRAPKGLSAPTTYGTKIPGQLRFPDFGDLTKPKVPEPAPVAVFGVDDPLPILRAKAARDPLVVDGDGEGLVDLAAAGLLDARRLVLYSPTFEGSPNALRAAVGEDGVLLVTDSNRRRGMRWASMSGNYGFTEQAGEVPLRTDLLDQRLELFPGSTDASRTVTDLRGVQSARATTYGTPAFGYSPDARPAAALDGRLLSSWEVASGLSAVGPETLRIDLNDSITTDRVRLIQPFATTRGRWITKVKLRFDGGHEVVRNLQRQSRTRRGQSVRFPNRTFSTLEIQIDGTQQNKVGSKASEKGRLRKTGVGFAEVQLRDTAPDGERSPIVRATEVTRMPKDLLAGLGASSLDHPLALVMTRAEPELRREFTLPTARSFMLTGAMMLSPNAADPTIDERLGVPTAPFGGITVANRTRLPVGVPLARASTALDGDPSTRWQTRGRRVRGQGIKVRLAQPVTIDRMDLQVLADGRHSVPTQIRIDTDTTSRVVDLPAVPVGERGVVTLPASFEAFTTDHLRVTITGIAKVTRRSLEWGNIVTLPASIAELGIPGVQIATPPVNLPEACIDDLLEVDGKPFSIRLTGTTAAALDGRSIAFEACDPTTPLRLDPGTHGIYGRMNHTTGLDFTRLVLSSAAGGDGVSPEILLSETGPNPSRAPSTKVLEQTRTSMEVEIADLSEPTWLVLGQSHNAGWHATVNGRDLGESVLVDGYANGWRIEPSDRTGPIRVSLEWEPQRNLWMAFALSGAGILVCLGILIVGWRRNRAAIVGSAASTPGTDDLDQGSLVNPFRAGGVSPRPRALVITAVATGIAAAVLVRPWTGLFVGGLVAAALVSTRWRGVLRVLPATMLVLIVGWISWGQLRHNYPPSFDWPIYFERLRTPAWLVIVLLAADAVVGLVRRADRGRDGR